PSTSRSRSEPPAPPTASASSPGESVGEVSRPLTALLLAFALGACNGPVVLSQKPGMSASFTDGRFQVEWGTAQTKDGKRLIAGYVTNTRGGGVANIRMQAQTLDAQGQVIDTDPTLLPSHP